MWKIYSISSGKILNAGFASEDAALAWLERKNIDDDDYVVDEMEDDEEEEWLEALELEDSEDDSNADGGQKIRRNIRSASSDDYLEDGDYLGSGLESTSGEESSGQFGGGDLLDSAEYREDIESTDYDRGGIDEDEDIY